MSQSEQAKSGQASGRKPRRTFWVFVRHSGCPFCHRWLERLSGFLPRLREKGVAVKVAHPGKPGDLDPAAERRGVGGVEIVADPGGELFSLFGFPRGGVGQWLGPRVWLEGFRAVVREGCPVGLPRGDVARLGGVAVTEGERTLYLWVQPHSGAEPPWEEAIDQCLAGLADEDQQGPREA